MCLTIYPNKVLNKLTQAIKFSQTLGALAQLCDGEVIGEATSTVECICSVANPVAGGLAYIGTAAASKQIDATLGVFYIVKPAYRELVGAGICHDNPQQAFRLILLALTQKNQPASIAESAVIADSARLGQGVSVAPHAVIGDDVVIGAGCQIGCGAVIEAGVHLGDNTRIGHRTIIHHDCHIGQDCVISEGAVIGGQGFGFSFEGGNWQAIPQIGRVVIGNRVHIGANSCVDRGAIDDTVIGNNVIIDNLVHIAHNVHVGDGTAMAAGVGIAGSTKVGKHCLLAGQVGVVGHIEIVDGVQVNGGARVLQSIKKTGVYAGSFNVLPVRQWNKLTVYSKKLETLFTSFKREKSS